jgi:hypothetical protein
VIDLVHLKENGERDIVPNQLKVRAAQQMGNIRFLRGKKIVQTDDIVAFFHELFAHVRPEKTRSSCNKDPLYARHSHSPILHPIGGKREIDLILDAAALQSCQQ